MDLYIEMVLKNGLKQLPESLIKEFFLESDRWVEMQSYRALRKIKDILEDDSLSDEDCEFKIDEIICVFEELGSGCNNRHDYG